MPHTVQWSAERMAMGTDMTIVNVYSQSGNWDGHGDSLRIPCLHDTLESQGLVQGLGLV
jgi:hypothetical protein